jgi:hypothetical protein
MRAFGRLLVVVAAALGGLVGSQFPEFAQQYRQRLGGALDEMRQVVADFDADASRNHLTRDQALSNYGAADAGFLRDQGASMQGAIGRYERLNEQRSRLDAAPPLMRPVVVLSGPDRRVLRGAWADFDPAVPVTPSGFLWAGIGFVAAAGLVSLLRQLGGIALRGVRARRTEAAP